MRRHSSTAVTALAAALALVTLTACGARTVSEHDTGSRPPAGPPVTDGRWTVTALTAGGERTPAPAGAGLAFPAKGALRGNYGCNHFGADAELTGDVLAVEPRSATEMACPQKVMVFEGAMKEALAGRLDLKLSGDEKKLTLTNRGAGVTIELAAEAHAPLAGTTWTVNSLIRGGAETVVPADAAGAAQLTFGAGGDVRGNLGCNGFTGTAKITGAKIVLGPLVTTKMLCHGGKGKVEAHLRTVLDGAAAYGIEHRKLTLSGPGGTRFTAVPAG
jgi:heat shock protein HslJ